MKNSNINEEYVSEVRRILCTFIKEIRIEKKMSQQQLADELGVSFGTVSKIELGKWLSLEMLIKLAIVLDFYPFIVPKDSNDELAVMMRNRWDQLNNKN